MVPAVRPRLAREAALALVATLALAFGEGARAEEPGAAAEPAPTEPAPEPAPAAAAPDEAPLPPEPIVVGFRITGMHALDREALEQRLATQVTQQPLRVPIVGPIWTKLFRDLTPHRLDPDAFAVDRRRVEAWYRERGYYAAKVTDAIVEPAGPGKVRVELRVDEGQPVRVTKVTVNGLQTAPEAARHLGKLPIAVGNVFTEAAYDQARALLQAALRSNGYAEGEVRQEARVLPAEREAEVTYTVKPGQRFKFGAIFVAGSATVPRPRIRRQAELELTPGDWWDEEKLGRAQARVFDLGVFGGVQVKRSDVRADRGAIDVVVAVREAPFRTLRAGPGLGLQGGNRIDVNGTVGFTNRNFAGDLRRLTLELRAGYARLLAPRKEGPVALAVAEFQQPQLLGPRIDATARLEVERGLESAYDFWSERLRLGLPWKIWPRVTFVPSFNLEVYQLANVAETFVPSTLPGGGTQQGPELNNCVNNVCLLSYLEQRVVLDLRDDPVNTRRGVYLSLAVQEGTNLGGYGYRYLRFLPEARGFLPLSARVVLAARARLGALVPLNEPGEPPIVARFTAGGPQSMRGYQTGRLSPMVLRGKEWVSVGGNGLADGSLELRVALNRSWGTAFFVDAGDVSQASGVPTEWRTVLDPTRLQWAAGAGLRYATPFGPIRLDVGVRLPTDFASGVAFSRRFPGVPSAIDDTGAKTVHREPWLAVHLSIGESF